MPDMGPATPEELAQVKKDGDAHFQAIINPPPAPKRVNNPGGRPTLLTHELIDEAVKLAKLGAYDRVIAAKMKISWDAWAKWKNRGRIEQEGIYVEFVGRMDEAYAEAELSAMLIWRRGFLNDWKAASEYLARRYPKRWGRQRVEVTGPGGKPLPAPQQHIHVALDLSNLTDEELELVSKIASKGMTQVPMIEGEARVLPQSDAPVTRDTEAPDDSGSEPAA